MKEFIIKKNDSGQRLDKFLQKAAPGIPKSMLYKALRTKKIKLNGKRADGSGMLSEGDLVSCYLKDDFFNAPAKKAGRADSFCFMNVPAELSVVYEDSNILIVFKPAGLVVHDDDKNTADTLIARVMHYLYKSGSYSPESENSFTPALCNRLDRNTSGLVIAAKNAAALREVNRLIRENRVHKSYYCITAGKPPKKQDTIKAYHFKPSGSKIVKVSARKLPGYRDMITKYNVLASNGRLCLVKIDLITGRTHQIRAHMALIGAPLLGDDKYGLPEVNRQYNEKYQQLCAYRLAFEPEKDTLFSYLSGKRFMCNVPEFIKKYFPQFNIR
ncbi:MAG: RluA family pseudouridine synthase [Ruminococcus sp.]